METIDPPEPERDSEGEYWQRRKAKTYTSITTVATRAAKNNTVTTREPSAENKSRRVIKCIWNTGNLIRTPSGNKKKSNARTKTL